MATSALYLPVSGHPALEHPEQDRQAEGEAEVGEANNEVALPELEGARRELTGLLCDLEHAEDREQRCVLEYGDEVVAERRDDRPHGLWEYHGAQGLAPREAE